MARTTVTLEKHFKESGSNAKGGWTRHDFVTADDARYKTFDSDVAAKALEYMDQPLEIEYEVKEQGQWVNNILMDVHPADGNVKTEAAAPAKRDQSGVNRNAAVARAIEWYSVTGESLVEALDNGSFEGLCNAFVRYAESGSFSSALSTEGEAVEG